MCCAEGMQSHRVSEQDQRAPELSHSDSGPGDSHSADLMQLFAKAQRNLMEVNRSRLNALQDLGAAQARIADLGEICSCSEQLPVQDPCFAN